jgi:hypothetical protein
MIEAVDTPLLQSSAATADFDAPLARARRSG